MRQGPHRTSSSPALPLFWAAEGGGGGGRGRPLPPTAPGLRIGSGTPGNAAPRMPTWRRRADGQAPTSPFWRPVGPADDRGPDGRAHDMPPPCPMRCCVPRGMGPCLTKSRTPQLSFRNVGLRANGQSSPEWATNGQVWTRHLAPAAPAPRPSSPLQFQCICRGAAMFAPLCWSLTSLVRVTGGQLAAGSGLYRLLPGLGLGRGSICVFHVGCRRPSGALAVAGPIRPLLNGGGGGRSWNPKVQKFAYQKQRKSIFPFARFHVFPQ